MTTRTRFGVLLPMTARPAPAASRRSDELNRQERERREARDRELADLKREMDGYRRAAAVRSTPTARAFNVYDVYRRRTGGAR